MSTHWLRHDFDAETSELVVTAKLGPDNLASNFVVSLKDDDGLEGIESWEPRELNHQRKNGSSRFRLPIDRGCRFC